MARYRLWVLSTALACYPYWSSLHLGSLQETGALTSHGSLRELGALDPCGSLADDGPLPCGGSLHGGGTHKGHGSLLSPGASRGAMARSDMLVLSELVA